MTRILLLIGSLVGLTIGGCGSKSITAPRPDSLPPGVRIGFTSVPARGSFDPLRGLVAVSPVDSFRVACYIHVAGAWWTKPFWSEPATEIAPDHSFVIDITTGGVDEQADEIRVYLIAAGFTPPLAPQEGLPDSAAAGVIAVARAVR